MDMIITNMESVDNEPFPLGNREKYPSQLFFDILIGEDFSSPLWCPDYVVFAIVGTVIKLVEPAIRHNNKITSFPYGVILLYPTGDAIKRTRRLTPAVYSYNKKSPDIAIAMFGD